MTAITTSELWTLRQVFLPEAEAGGTRAPATRIPTRRDTARGVQMVINPRGMMVARLVLRATIGGVIGAAAARVRLRGLTAGRERHPSEADRGRGIPSAEGIGRAADQRVLPQPLQLQVVRRTSPLTSKEPRPTRGSPNYRATRSAGIAVPMVTSAKRHIAR